MSSEERDTLRQQLIEHEGERLHVYRCTSGVLTIGVGRNLESTGISTAESRLLLDNDITRCVNECVARFPWFPDLDPTRQRVIVDMCFQLGIGGLSHFRTTLKYVESKQYGLAADAMLQSKWAQQTPTRAARLSRWMRTGDATWA
jgi:lysozyme